MISAIMVVYNGERFLAESIQSVLIQEEDFELIIVDDGSTDRTEEIIRSFQDERIRYIKQKNQGFATARNTALSFAKGDFIVWQDADDISVPGRFKRLKSQFEDPSVDFVHSDVIYIDEKGLPYRYQHAIPVTQEHLLRFFLKSGSPYNNVSMMLRKSTLEGLQFDISLKCGSDTALIRQFVFHKKGVHLPLPLLLYRRHQGTMGQTYNQRKDRFPILQKLLNTYPIETLIPEAHGNRALASTILYYFLKRRLFTEESEHYLKQAKELAEGDAEILTFIEAMQDLADLKCTSALQTLEDLHFSLAENYKGEALLFLRRYQEAYSHLLKAIQDYPEYNELLENLKLAAVAQQIHLDSRQ